MLYRQNLLNAEQKKKTQLFNTFFFHECSHLTEKILCNWALNFLIVITQAAFGQFLYPEMLQWADGCFYIHRCSKVHVHSNYVMLAYCLTWRLSSKVFFSMKHGTFYARSTSQTVIIRTFQVSKSTITRLYQRLRQTGRQMTGQVKWTSVRHNTSPGPIHMRLPNLRDRFRTAVERAHVTPGTYDNKISPDTVRRVWVTSSSSVRWYAINNGIRLE